MKDEGIVIEKNGMQKRKKICILIIMDYWAYSELRDYY